jgi:hypothetical protein
MIRVVIPTHLRMLAKLESREISLEVAQPVTQRRVLDALEAKFPVLRGTLRDQETRKRRAMIRLYACKEDLSHEDPDAPLPAAVADGKEVYQIVAAIAGG